MSLREIIADLRQILPTILVVVLALAGAAAAVYLLPNRTAAVILGVLLAFALSTYVLRGLERATQLAITWLTIGVVADAAYAKLNDQTPVTIAGALVKAAEGLAKLVEVLIRSIGIGGGPNVQKQMASVAPEFVWALILTTTLLMVINLMGRERNANARAKPDIRRAA
jgi:prepilin signal peptidase PulO-like enzyme (type II secretory pathway)